MTGEFSLFLTLQKYSGFHHYFTDHPRWKNSRNSLLIYSRSLSKSTFDGSFYSCHWMRVNKKSKKRYLQLSDLNKITTKRAFFSRVACPLESKPIEEIICWFGIINLKGCSDSLKLACSLASLTDEKVKIRDENIASNLNHMQNTCAKYTSRKAQPIDSNIFFSLTSLSQ